MKVLLAVKNLMTGVGGGETFYRSLATSNPAIDFHFVQAGPVPDLKANLHPVTLRRFCRPHMAEAGATPILAIREFMTFLEIAAAVEGQHFDVVDVPDYSHMALYLPAALNLFGVRYDRLVMSMHGPLSTTTRWNWPEPVPAEIEHWLADTAKAESLAYQAADLRYGISRTLIEARAAGEGVGGHYLNPLRLDHLRALRPSLAVPAAAPPDLLFAARKERIKGPDLFLELLWWLPRTSYGAALLAGGDYAVQAGQSADLTLAQMMIHRKLDMTLAASRSGAELRAGFAARTVAVVPSRYDSLNLVALESLLSGCPAAISRFAGVTRFLHDSFPGLPWLEIDPTDPVVAAERLRPFLAGYDDERARLVEHLQTRPPIIDGESLEEIYCSPPRRILDHGAVIALTRPQLVQMLESGILAFDDAPLPPDRPPATYQTIYRPIAAQPDLSRAAVSGRDLSEAVSALRDRYRHYAAPGAGDVAARREILRGALMLGLDRGRIFHQLAQLAYQEGNGLLGAAYDLRVMRLAGGDRFGRVAAVARALRQVGMAPEAAAAEALYGDAAAAPARCDDILDQVRARCRDLTPAVVTRTVDQRSNPTPRVALIISLYNAAAKMPRFLDLLNRQTLICDGAVEVIFVDSASPCDEWPAIAAAAPRECLYLRTAARESIAQAWNHGIAASRAPYLSFLGVDETLRPDALAVLAAALDAAPAIDWVQASAVQVRTDATGRFAEDDMANDRKTVDADFLLVDTTYIGHVPGLYRRSLHDRFGWYDGRLRGASDTEFKLRAFRGLRVQTLEATLGEYLNYPEVRTTATAAIEVEDLRAWYLPRSEAAIATLAAGRSPDQIARLIGIALNHRKSYIETPSTDIDLAVALLRLLQRQAPDHPVNRLAAGTLMLQEAYRRMDFLGGFTPISGPIRGSGTALAAALALIARAAGDHRDQGLHADYVFYNDNRCQQHYWIWPA
ncbi:MAG: glycosyltransferase [Azospirillaceae bacterium]|nr:glycosyltransferase [Azospirillaceae bacterium]